MSCFSSLNKCVKHFITFVIAKFTIRKESVKPAEVEEVQRKVVVHRHIIYIMLCTRATRVSYDCSTGGFASSSCHGEVTQFEYRGGLKKSSLGGLRRNSSHGYEMDSIRGGICEADATNIEIDLTSFTQTAFDVKIETPTGEIGFMTFTTTGVAQSFTPALNGCGHGKWTIRIFKQLQSGHEEVSCESVEINGVGTLFFTVDETLTPRHEAHNFLQMRMCPKHRRQ